jgi:hypothetical protein
MRAGALILSILDWLCFPQATSCAEATAMSGEANPLLFYLLIL